MYVGCWARASAGQCPRGRRKDRVWLVFFLTLFDPAYYYTDANGSGGLQESSGSLGSSGAIYNSVSSIYSRSSDEGVLVWNDENPNGEEPSWAAHAKGMLYFDGQSGMLLIHSVPKAWDLTSLVARMY